MQETFLSAFVADGRLCIGFYVLLNFVNSLRATLR